MKTKLRSAAASVLLLCLLVGCLSGFVYAADSGACPFTDIDGTTYHDDIVMAYFVGLMNGVSKTRFDPYSTMTRAMFVVTLYRAHRVLFEDVPAVTKPSGWSFRDIPAQSWYTEAVYWAYEQGITNGTDKTHFSPHLSVTREQAATFLYRYEKQYGSHVDSQAYLGGCDDASQISAYARRPMMWLSAIDPAQPTSGRLHPRGSVQRQELAHLLVNYCVQFSVEGDTVLRPQPKDSSVTLFFCGEEAGTCAMLDGTAYLRLDAQKVQLLGLNAEESVVLDMPTLTLRRGSAVLTLTDAFPDASLNGKKQHLGAPPLYQDGEWYLPMQEVLVLLGLDVIDDSGDTAQVFVDRPVLNTQVMQGIKIPVLEFHAVSDQIAEGHDPNLYISPDDLREEIEWLLSQSYTFISFEDLDCLDIIYKPVMLTFDDGYLNNYEELFPILQEYNIKATLFVVTQLIGTTYHVTEEQLRQMQESGLVSIQSHTATHPYLPSLNAEQTANEFRRSRVELARITHRIPFVLCYPYGRSGSYGDTEVRKLFQFALYVQYTPYGYITGNDPYRIYRHEVLRGTSLERFISDFTYWVNHMK